MIQAVVTIGIGEMSGVFGAGLPGFFSESRAIQAFLIDVIWHKN